MNLDRLWMVFDSRCSVIRDCGKLYERIFSERVPDPICMKTSIPHECIQRALITRLFRCSLRDAISNALFCSAIFAVKILSASALFCASWSEYAEYQWFSEVLTWCCDLSAWIKHVRLVGICVIFTALSVLFTCCPPAPWARHVSMRRSWVRNSNSS